MSSASESAAKTASFKPTKVVIPKVWKRPHSTIYGKNVEFGSKLTSDKLGEINGRKFNSDLPWQVRNSGSSSTTTSAGSSSSSQGYLSKLLNEPETTLIGSVLRASGSSGGGGGAVGSSDGYGGGVGVGGSRDELTVASCSNYADVLDVTNPNRYSKRRRDNNLRALSSGKQSKNKRIDFFENYLNFNNEINRMNESSRLMNEPLLHRRVFDKNLDFNYELGLFVPSASSAADHEERSLLRKRTLQRHHEAAMEAAHSNTPIAAVPVYNRALDNSISSSISSSSSSGIGAGSDRFGTSREQQRHHPSHHYDYDNYNNTDNYNNNNRHMFNINNQNYHHHQFNPVVTTTQQTNLLPRHHCQLASSPYGQSADGRKLSLGSINPHSYRPSLPNRSTTVHASDGEEFEFQDRSSPFYTDRWAGKTIRHFDSDLYSNANLFKSMIL